MAAKKERAAKALDRMESTATPPKEKARFFHDLAPIRAGIHMKVPRKDAKGERWLTLLFRITLNGNLVRSAPESVRTAFDDVQRRMLDYAGVPLAIENVNVDVYETDSTKNPSIELKDVTINNLEVKEIRSGKNDISIVLTFEVEYLADSDLWRFMRTHFGGDVFLVFDSAQASLLDLVDAATSKEDDKQAKLPISGKDQAANDAVEA
jgi:hypothetical protein